MSTAILLDLIANGAKKPEKRREIPLFVELSNSLLEACANDLERSDLAEVITKTNAALKKLQGEDRLQLAIELLKVWKDETMAVEFFGFGTRLRSKFFPMMFSLTATGEQLRVWYGPWGTISEKHFDSNGHNLLLSISGEKDEVQEYLNAFLKISSLAPATYSNGCRAYIGWAS